MKLVSWAKHGKTKEQELRYSCELRGIIEKLLVQMEIKGVFVEHSESSSINVNKSPFIISDTIDDLVIVIHINSGAYYSLTKNSSTIWAKVEAGEKVFDKLELKYIKGFVDEQILLVQESLEHVIPIEFSELATKYTDMEELFLGDPIHGVDEQGWPAIKLDKQ